VKLPLRITTRLNGEVVQDGTTDDMIFSWRSLYTTLAKG